MKVREPFVNGTDRGKIRRGERRRQEGKLLSLMPCLVWQGRPVWCRLLDSGLGHPCMSCHSRLGRGTDRLLAGLCATQCSRSSGCTVLQLSGGSRRCMRCRRFYHCCSSPSRMCRYTYRRTRYASSPRRFRCFLRTTVASHTSAAPSWDTGCCGLAAAGRAS